MTGKTTLTFEITLHTTKHTVADRSTTLASTFLTHDDDDDDV